MNIDLVYEHLKKYIPAEKLMLREPMYKHTSFKIGGPADIMVLPGSIEEIAMAVKVCRTNDCPYFVMGNGTNLLVKDGGYRGVIIKIGSNFSDYRINQERIYSQAGILLSALSQCAAESALEGLEFASGIPGTLGGAVAMNAGAYEGEMKDVVEWARVVTNDGEVKVLSVEELEMGYRTSIVQRQGLIVADCCLRLKKGEKEKIYEKIKEYTRLRKAKQPLHLPSAGSTFKRPQGYYAGKLIEEAGLKGKRIGDVQVSEMHCGFIVNLGNASARDVLALIDYVRQEVKKKFGVELEPEVKIIGED